jgi:uncharacterized membrane protein/predicted secreted protein
MLKINFTMKRNLAITNFLFIPLIWLYLISCEAAPTFELLEIQPQSIQIRKGEFGTFVLTIIPKNGFSGVVSFELLDRKTNGSIVGIDISPVAASIVGVSSQTFIVNVASFVEPKKYQLKIRVSYGASNFKEKNIDIEVLPQPAFSLGEPIPNYLVVPIGGSASFSVPITPQDGFKGKISLELRDINTNSQMLDFSLFPNEISLLEPVTQTIVLNVNYTAKEGTYNLKLRGVSGDTISDTKFQVVVSGQIGPIVVPQIPQYFEISELAPRSITLPRGGKANLSVSIVPKNDFKGQISLEILERNSNSLIEGINLFPYSLHILEPVTQTITLYANPEIPEGEYKLKIRAVSGSIFDDENLDVKIIPPPAEEPPGDGTAPQPSFDISDLNPPSLTIGKGEEGYFLVQITPQNGFYGDIFFDVLSGASVVTWLTLNPQSVRVFGGLSQQIYVKVSPNAITGNYSLKFRASSGSISREKNFSLNITEGTPAPPSQPSSYFEISDPYPPSLTIGKGDEGYFLVQITPQNGFYGDIFFDVLSGASIITWLTLNPQSVRVFGGMTQQIYVKVSPNAITGNFSLKLRASSGSIFREKNFSLNITEGSQAPPSPSFEISDPNPVSLVVAAGQIKTFSLTITPQNGFSGLVNLYVVDRNTDGTIYGISVTPYSISVNQQVTQVVSLNVDSSVSSGYYALKIKVSSGGIVREKNIDLFVPKLWAKAYGSTGNDEAYSIQRTKDGGFIVAGYMTISGTNTDVWILKLDPDGNIQWQKVFGGPFADAAYEVKESYDGSFIVAGSSVTSVPTTQRNGFIAKLDSNGNFVWSLTYGGTADDEFRSLTISQEGGTEYIIVTGYTKSFGSGGEDAWILKVNSSDGSIMWQKRYGTSNDDRFQRVITSSYNGSISYVFAGRTFSSSTNFDFWVMITDENGNTKMSKKYFYPSLSPGDEFAWDIKETPDGAFVVVDLAQRYIGSGGRDIWILKIRKDNGEIIWQKAFGGQYDDEARSAVVAENGDIIIAGTANSLVSSSSTYDIWILRLDKDGNLKWQKVFGLPGSNADLASSICLSDDGNFVVAGYTTTSGGGNDIFVMKITPDGYIKFNSGSSMRSQDSLGLDITTYAISQDVSTSFSTTSASPTSSNFTSQDRTYWIVHHAP